MRPRAYQRPHEYAFRTRWRLVSVRRKLYEHRAAADGAPTWPGGCAQPFTITATGDAVRTKNALGRAPFGHARAGCRFHRVLVPSPTPARTAVGCGTRFERPTRCTDVVHSPDARRRRKMDRRSL